MPLSQSLRASRSELTAAVATERVTYLGYHIEVSNTDLLILSPTGMVVACVYSMGEARRIIRNLRKQSGR